MLAAGADRAEHALRVLNADLAGSPYLLVGQIGAGGMGAVYEARHRALGRRLVLKVVRHPHRPDHVERLRFEAQALSQLSHPNLLSVTDYGVTPSGRGYLVTEFLVGKTMQATLGEFGVLSIEEACQYAEQALSGLAHAHRAGVVHRDLKTENLFVCDGHELYPIIKIIDFGIAKIVEGEGGKVGVEVEPLDLPTADGIMVGTPAYMSPEQAKAEAIDHRADIYGLSTVLYRMLAGRTPFVYPDLLQLVTAIAIEPPRPPSEYAPEPVPKELEAIVLKGLAKQPEQRFQSALDMRKALADFRQSHSAKNKRDLEAANTIVRSSGLQRVTLMRGIPPVLVELATNRTARGTERMMDAPGPQPATMEKPTLASTGQAPEMPIPPTLAQAGLAQVGLQGGGPRPAMGAPSPPGNTPIPYRTPAGPVTGSVFHPGSEADRLARAERLKRTLEEDGRSRSASPGYRKWVFFALTLVLVGIATFYLFRFLGLD